MYYQALLLLYIFVIVFGLIIGSFINCFIWRLYKRESLLNRSYCPNCLHMIAWYDNIPVFSYLFLRAKCRHCKKSISAQYPVVELLTGILFLLAFIFNLEKFGIDNILYINSDPKFIVSLIRDWFIIFVMIVIFIYDFKWYLILDIVTLPSCLLIFIINIYLGFSWSNLLISGIIGAGFFLFQFVVSKGKWIGGGDIRLGLLMGFILGYPLVILAIFISYIIGSVIGIGLIVSKNKKWESQVPLGIFLTTGTIITLFWGQNILNWYLNLILF